MEAKLPAPCLVVLIGPSGSGKTTWAHANFRENEVLSSDELRAMVGIDEDDQRASTKAFEILDIALDERLARGLTTVVDSTGLSDESRIDWVARAHAAGVPAYAAVMRAPVDVCLERNARRDRPLPKSVITKQASRFNVVVEQLADEKFDGVVESEEVAVVAPQLAAEQQVESSEAPQGHSFGLLLSRFNWPDDADLPGTLASIGREAEAAGFRDIWLMDHFRQIHQVGRRWEDMPEVYTTLAYLSGVTSRIRLGALVTGITHRNIALLGKMIATLDVLSGGRAVCGLGIGWDAAEHDAYGISFPGVADRYDLLADALEALPLLWGKGAPEFQGRRFSAKELICYPRPIQDPVPIMVGGSGERRTLRFVAEAADACNLFGSPDRVAGKVGVLRSHCADVGRDPEEIEVTHLVTALSATDRESLRDRVDAARGRNESIEDFIRANNAGTTDNLVSFFGAYHEAGATHSIVSIPDVWRPGAVEAFGDLIEAVSED